MDASCDIKCFPQSELQLELSHASENETKNKTIVVELSENHYGGYDENFVNPLPSDLKCPVCFLALRQPIQTEECGHRFCESCIKNIKRIEGQLLCSLDRQMIDLNTVFLDKAAKRAILSLPIRCRYHERNCEWIGDISTIDDHLKECGFVDVSCPNSQCQVLITRNNLLDHLDLFCEFRIIDCQYCTEKYIFNDKWTHLNICPMQPLECINECGEKGILRMMMPKHVENECPVNVQYCEYAKIKCDFKGTQSQRDAHVISSANLHLTLSIEKITKLENKFSYQVEQATNLAIKYDALKKKEDLLEALIRTVERQISSLENKLVNIDTKSCLFESRLPKNEYLWCLDSIDFLINKEKKPMKDLNICSTPFYSAPFGYKLSMQIYLNGLGKYRGTNILLFLNIIKGEYDSLLEWPFTKMVKLSLLDQSEARDHKVFVIDPKINENFNKANSYIKRVGVTIPLKLLTCPGYLIENKIIIKCEVES
ncbi:TNF receptor-associated factor 4 isoform X2 [Hydra vulgaris]|uniref:TNF receptor-associated factor 4 isoform X2 n=1 Tax=Hydra vulgaris TaxID=6087 RepID=UPI001F5F530B|nr:TNF receptor-associated factor 4 isoform X2 [Hydra vulgaris]